MAFQVKCDFTPSFLGSLVLVLVNATLLSNVIKRLFFELLPVVGQNTFVDHNDEKRTDSVKRRRQEFENHRGTLAGRAAFGIRRRSFRGQL